MLHFRQQAEDQRVANEASFLKLVGDVCGGVAVVDDDIHCSRRSRNDRARYIQCHRRTDKAKAKCQ